MSIATGVETSKSEVNLMTDPSNRFGQNNAQNAYNSRFDGASTPS